jgi:nucleotidyltransferase AbiEii toxin of type IV toxin-antitoxin system
LSHAEAVLRRIVQNLRDLDRRFALVGGLAVSARTEPRLTRDADLAVLAADDQDAEGLVRDLQARGWRVVAAIEQSSAGRLAAVRLALAGEDERGAVVDLLFASSGIELEVVTAADRIEAVPGFALPVARLGHLIALKVLARDDRTRPQDRVDLAALLSCADAAALSEARASLDLVTRRGYARGRDLLGALVAAMNEFRD